ncbi:PilZ domain-containing protein [uncultured Pseudodesulfovibrio sp.]|uniref:PilZ domain-containing protein n=1 Tax=uncultured Pseudodesulfovibrio sp. TaxID=2035858 RepID=UPI0029C91D58|nr:PilZ domain-containing protein [uncultured Pseudodesulfovibrio sp.]
MDIVSGDRVVLEFSTFEDRFLGVVSTVTICGDLVVKVAVPDAIGERVNLDTFALVRYAFEGRLLGFSSRVLDMTGGSDATVILAGPESVFDAEDREEPRCSCSYPAIVIEGRKAAQAVVEDMSTSCSRVRFLNGGLTDFPEELGRPVRLSFQPFDTSEESYSVGCTVLKAFMKSGERYAVLKFNDDEPDARQRLSCFFGGHVCCVLPIM